jgi:uncharacterized membrane protein
VKRETLIVGGAFGAMPVVIVSLAVACTWAIAHGASSMWRLPFRFLCHGIARRCLLIWGTPMPICARCTAIYAGLFVGLLFFVLLPLLHERIARYVMFIAATPMAVDGITQALRLRESTNSLRIATGAAAGFTFGYWLLSAIERRDKDTVTAS